MAELHCSALSYIVPINASVYPLDWPLLLFDALNEQNSMKRESPYWLGFSFAEDTVLSL